MVHEEWLNDGKMIITRDQWNSFITLKEENEYLQEQLKHDLGRGIHIAENYRLFKENLQLKNYIDSLAEKRDEEEFLQCLDQALQSRPFTPSGGL